MKLIADYSEIQNGIANVKALKDGFLTNFFIDQEKISLWLEKKILFSYVLNGTIFFLKYDHGFYSLFYTSTNENSLKNGIRHLIEIIPNDTIVLDLVGNKNIFFVKDLFQTFGFNEYTYLVRMSRVLQETQVDFVITDNLKECDLKQVDEILLLFHAYFDYRAEQIPMREELIKWVELASVLVYEINNKVVGFLIYNLNGLTLYLRYWFVHPDFRDKKIGGILFKYFLYKGSGTKRQLFWVINTNENAINKYKHYGFKEEEMYNFVLINRDMSYEK